jgi:hypothetical protein
MNKVASKMTPERWQQVKGVLQEALELAPAQRPAFLDRVCSTGHSLRREEESQPYWALPTLILNG